MDILKLLPKEIISYIVGSLAHIKVPNPFRMILLKWFANKYKLNLSEAKNPIESFESIGKLFTRELKEDARIIESELVSPADGYLRNAGVIPYNGFLEQIKNKNYNISELLANNQNSDRFMGGSFFNIYLSPKDYHRVHFPVSGEIKSITYVPGKLWPVNDWSLSNIDKLFCVNERIVTYIQSRFGLIAVVMVGATNVGKMSLSFDSILSNMSPFSFSKEVINKNYNQPIICNVGTHLGTFHLGSTVVMLLEKDFNFNELGGQINCNSRTIKLGNSLTTVE